MEENTNFDKDYLKIKFFLENDLDLELESEIKDFMMFRLGKSNIEDSISELVNYGIQSFYLGFFIEALRSFIKALQKLEEIKSDLSDVDYDETLEKINININYCKEKWSDEKIEFLRKEIFFKPFTHYLKKNDVYVFSVFNKKNIMKEFIWKVCFSITNINPNWSIFFIDNFGQDIFIYINHPKDKKDKKDDKDDNLFYLYKPEELEDKGDKEYLKLVPKNSNSDLNSRIALSNYIIVNQRYFVR